MAVKEKEHFLTYEQIKDKCKSIEKSSHCYQSIIRDCKNPKFINLDRWIDFESECFKKENSNKSRTKYKTYKPGTIIFANFGISIGSEFSGYHFAITLTKKDNPYNDSLTVIPLTSKNKKENISLEKELINKIIENTCKETLNVINISQAILGYFQTNDLPFDEEVSIKDKLIIDYLSKYSDKPSTEDGTLHLNDTDIISMINTNMALIQNVKEYYKKNNKVSYASVGNITTISKFRIKKPLNRMDPIGRIRVSDEILTLIEQEIIKKFTSQPLTSDIK